MTVLKNLSIEITSASEEKDDDDQKMVVFKMNVAYGGYKNVRMISYKTVEEMMKQLKKSKDLKDVKAKFPRKRYALEKTTQMNVFLTEVTSRDLTEEAETLIRKIFQLREAPALKL